MLSDEEKERARGLTSLQRQIVWMYRSGKDVNEIAHRENIPFEEANRLLQEALKMMFWKPFPVHSWTGDRSRHYEKQSEEIPLSVPDWRLHVHMHVTAQHRLDAVQPPGRGLQTPLERVLAMRSRLQEYRQYWEVLTSRQQRILKEIFNWQPSEGRNPTRGISTLEYECYAMVQRLQEEHELDELEELRNIASQTYRSAELSEDDRLLLARYIRMSVPELARLIGEPQSVILEKLRVLKRHLSRSVR